MIYKTKTPSSSPRSTARNPGGRSLTALVLLLALGWITGRVLSSVLTASFFLLMFSYVSSHYSYWRRLGVKCPDPPFLVGHTLQRLGITRPFMQFLDDLYYNYDGKNFCGFYDFLKPGILVGKPDLIKKVLVRDFIYFADRRTLDLGKVNPIANDMLTNARGSHWRHIRSVVSPTFSGAKTRRLYPLILQRARHLVKVIRSQAMQGPVEARTLCGRYTMDTIASCAFGIECDALNSAEAAFPVMAGKLLQLSPARALKILILLVAPRIAEAVQRVGIDFTSPEFHFFRHVVTHTLRKRQENNIYRGDFLDLLMEAKKKTEDELSDTTMAAQCILFLLAGYDNTANTLAVTLHLLALHPATQAALRREMIHAKCRSEPDEELDPDIVRSMTMLDAVTSETLRLYPAAPIIERTCTKNYMFGEVELEPGTPLVIPVWSVHRDPNLWHLPDQFRPERFLSPEHNKQVPYSYLPFGLGPRSCIGLQFAMMGIKLGLVELLTHFEVKPGPQTVDPLPLDPKVLTLQPMNGVPVCFEPIEDLESHVRQELLTYPPVLPQDILVSKELNIPAGAAPGVSK
ncbi:putative cytochrome P450 6a13 isoform X2 [Oratosquilla oratoria]